MSETIFLAGASGAIGRRLLPLLTAAGHRVTGISRTKAGAETIRRLGAEAEVVDVYDAEALAGAVARAAPTVVIHQLTGLAGLHRGEVEAALAENARLRTVGTRNLVDAAVAAGARRMIAQSIAWVYAPGPEPHPESDPLDLAGKTASAQTVKGVAALEEAVLGAPGLEGIVLRYGRFFGPGTGQETVPKAPSVHVDAAAMACLLAIGRGAPGSVFNVADPNGVVATEAAGQVLGWRPGFRMVGMAA